METVRVEGQPGQSPASVVQGLRCAVCLEFFEKPHTLACGHTFCLRCLKTIARLIRHARQRTPLERLKFRCPSCRKFTPALPIFRRKAAINFALKELADEWFRSPISTGTVQEQTFRSVAVQAETPCPDDDVKAQSDAEDACVSAEDVCISAEEFHKVTLHRLETDKLENARPRASKVTLDSSLEEVNVSSAEEATASESNPNQSSEYESSDSEEQELDRFPVRRISRLHVTSVSSVLRLFFQDCSLVYRGVRQSRSRTILTIFWCVYGVAVVALSQNFLPWMCFYTVVFFFILYVEMAHPALFHN